jgi:hypothetical protein
MTEISHLLDEVKLEYVFWSLWNIHIIFVTPHKIAQLLHIIQI